MSQKNHSVQEFKRDMEAKKSVSNYHITIEMAEIIRSTYPNGLTSLITIIDCTIDSKNNWEALSIFKGNILFESCDLKKVEFNVFEQGIYKEFSFKSCDLSGAKFIGKITITKFWGCSLNSIKFENVEFKGIDILKLDFKQTDFSNCIFGIEFNFKDIFFESCIFESCQIIAKNISNCSFIKTNFKKCNITQSLFQLVKCENVKFKDCDLSGVKFISGSLENVSFLGGRMDLETVFNKEKPTIIKKNIIGLQNTIKYVNLHKKNKNESKHLPQRQK